MEFGEAFPCGALAVGEPQPQRDFDRSTREKPVQAVDEETGLPIWSVDILDADPEVNKSGRSLSVRLISEYCPVLPELPAGTPSHLAFMRPVEFEGLTASPYVADGPGGGKGRLSWSFRATGMKAPTAVGASEGSATAAGSPSGAGGRSKSATSGTSAGGSSGEKAAA